MLLLTTCFGLTSCDSDDEKYEYYPNLEITFGKLATPPESIDIQRLKDNAVIATCRVDQYERKTGATLEIGNYYVTGGYAHQPIRFGFQIRKGQKTIIFMDGENMIADIKYRALKK